MQLFNEAPPFQLGETLKGTMPGDSSTLINNDKLGVRHAFPHVDYSITGNTQSRSLLSGHKICAIALRNESGVTLLGKRLALLTLTAGYSQLKSVDGYARPYLVGKTILIDPWLPSGGVADDDIFWGIYQGPAMCLTPTVAADFVGAVTAGAPLVAATAATTQTSSAGRIANITLPGQTGDTQSVSAALNLIGFALSTKTTDLTNSDLLVNLALRI